MSQTDRYTAIDPDITGLSAAFEQAAAEPPASLAELINQYADARAAREDADDVAKRLKEEESILEARLFDEMERSQLRNVKHARGTFLLNDLAWATVTDEAAIRAYAETEMPEILLPNAARLAVVVREALRGERDMPPGVEARFTRKIGWRRR